jgi:hypothetical protein
MSKDQQSGGQRTVGDMKRDPHRDRDDHGRIRHPNEDLAYACPHCDRASVHLRIGDNVSRAPEFTCWCDHCERGSNLADIIVREINHDFGEYAKQGVGGLSEIGRAAVNADPGDVL